MDTLGQHLLVEFYGCDSKTLNDYDKIQSLMVQAAQAAGATVVGKLFHRFSPQGVSGVVVVEESHLSIHTWPEKGYAAVDFYTCGECLPDQARKVLTHGLEAQKSEWLKVDRGVDPQCSIVIREHDRERQSPALRPQHFDATAI